MNDYIITEKDGRMLGTYSPTIMSLFVNAFMHKVEGIGEECSEQSKRVYFHELFHNWQSLFTPFGLLRMYTEDECTNRIVSLWERMARINSEFRRIPIAHLMDSENEKSVALASLMKVMYMDFEIVKIMQYGYDKDKLGLFDANIPDYISPVVIYKQRKYVVNGIDIIESFDKYQEALYGEYITGESFDKVLDIEKLSETYYFPLIYYISEVGNTIEFPIACETALMTNSIGDIMDENNWKECSPAWRFCKIVQLIKEDKDMPHVQSDRMHETYLEMVNYILNKCGYTNYKVSYQKFKKKITDKWSDPFVNETNLAVDFKQRYPGLLAYPFLCDGECVDKMYMFEPHFLQYIDISMALSERDELLYGYIGGNKHKWMSRLGVELHRKALAYQIMGCLSSRTVYYDVLFCGCSYFGIDACPYYNRECNGYLENDSDLKYTCNDIEAIRSLVMKIKEERRDENIENYEKYIRKQDFPMDVKVCPLDMIFCLINGFSITDISVNLKCQKNIEAGSKTLL